MKKLITAIAASTIAFVATAAIIVKDSFDTGGYATVGATLKGLTAGESTGFAGTSKWGAGGGTGVFFVNGGLSFPSDFAFEASGNAIGVGNYVGNYTGNREISRQIKPDIIDMAGTYYIRFACAITDSAEKYLDFKGFEMLGLLPEAHNPTEGISYPSSNGLQFGFYKFAAGDGNTALAVLKQGGSNANTGALKLVDPIVPGKTYIVVAKVVLDGEGGAEVYAMAGATDDAAFRSAELPSTPLEIAVSASAPLRYLVVSGTFMTGYGSGTTEDRWVSFDEFAIGESLEDVFGFSNLATPLFGASETSAITTGGFTATCALTQLGESSPEVFLDLSCDGGETFDSASVGIFNAVGSVTTNVTDLLAGSTYSWRFRAVGTAGAATNEWQTVTLAGIPVLGEPSATVEDSVATLSVSLVTPGLLGEDDTTVELWFAESGQPLALAETFTPTAIADDFSATVEDLSLGSLYCYAFHASVPYNSGILETWTVTNSVSIPGDLTWTGATETTDWNTAGNWSPQIAPNERLSTSFTSIGGEVTASADGSASSIFVNTDGNGTSFDFGGHGLTANSLNVGNGASRSRAALANGDYAFDQVVVGGANYRQSSCLHVGSGANLLAGSMDIGFDSDPGAASNSVVFAAGSKTDVSGTLLLRSSRGTSATVEQGASLAVGGLNLSAVGASLVVDGGTLTNSGHTMIFKDNRRGTVRDNALLVLKNGAICRSGPVDIGAGFNYSSQSVHGEMQVLDGAVLDASGYGIFIDQGERDFGPNADSGHGAIMVVSNATVLANTISVNNEDRHHDDVLLVHEDEGMAARVAVASNLRIACATQTRSGHFNYDNRMRVESGEVSIGGSLIIGDGGQHYANHASNRVEVAGSNPRISASAMNVLGMSFIDFEIPAGGYAGTPLSVSGTAKFNEVPAGQNASTWVPVNGIRIDASNFIGTQVLISAGSIAGLDIDRVSVTTPKSRKATVILSETSLSVKVAGGATILQIH